MDSESTNIEIREWCHDDNISRITEMLHRAYAQLAELGFRYHATWQGDDVTLKRLSKGFSFLAVNGDVIVGTITLYVPPSVSGCSWYDRGDVASFGQFGVDPSYQESGIGSKLLEVVETETRKRDIPNLALDTAEGSTHLIELYERRGFQFVEYVEWEKANFRSVIMNKEL